MVDQQILRAGSAEFGLVNVPDQLFKFFNDERHGRALVERGGVRVGTLYEFRHTDGWDNARGDGEEGQFTFSLTSANPELITRENAPWFLRPVIDRLGTAIASRGGTLNAVARHPDAFMYCTTATSDRSVIGSYGSVGVVIHDVPAFFSALTRHLADELGLVALVPHGYAAPCLYVDRELRLDNSQTPVNEPPLAFLKPARKREEREVRAVWHPLVASDALEPVVTECPELVGLTEILAAT